MAADFDAGSIEATLDVDRSPFQEGLQLARRQAEEFAQSRYEASLDADTRAGEAHIAAFKGRLDELRRERVSVDVNADTTAADMALAETASEAQAVGSESPTIRVDADTAAARAQIAGIWSWAAALGPIAIPIVAGGVGGIFGITAALGAATAAAGTAYLGFSGVGDVVKDMGTASEKAGAQAVKSAGAQANSAQQLQLAEMSLANARANASDQAVAAEERLANAQRQERDAQEALTQARADAADQLRSYDLQLEDAALAERQAQLSIAEAKQRRDEVMRDRSASSLDRQEAQLAYDQAVQHSKDLQFQDDQLREKAAAAAKAGVDGSDQVRQAQEQLRTAQQGVVDAQRAQEAQQRQSALAVAQAQAAVASAMSSGASAAGAMDASVSKLNHDLEALSPAGREFAKFLYDTKDDLLALRLTAQQNMLPGLEDGIKAVLPLLPTLDQFIGNVASSLGDMADQDLRALNTARWEPFFSYIDSNAVPTLVEMNDVLGNSAHGWAELLIAFEPVEQMMGAGLERMSRNFDDFASHTDENSSFQHFLAYVEANGPRVAHTIGDVGGALGAVVAAAAPLGPPLLQVVDLLARLVSMNPELVALGLEWYFWNRTLTSLAGTLTSGARALGLFSAESKAAAATARGGAAAFNPLTAAVAAATLGFFYLTGKEKDYADQQQAASDKAYASIHTYSALNTSLTEQAEALDKARNSWNVLSDAPFDTFVKASVEVLEFNENIHALTQNLGLSRDAAVVLAQAAGVDLRSGVEDVTNAVELYVQSNFAALTSNTQLTPTILEVDAAVYQAKDGFNAYQFALSAVIDIQDDAYSSNVDYKQSLSDMTKQLAKSKKTFDDSTDAGRANIRMVEAAKNAAEREAAATYKSTYQSSKLTDETDRRREATAAANKVLDKDVESLIQQGIKAGYSRDQMQTLLEKMGVLTNTKAVAHVGTSGVGPTSQALDDITKQLRYINDHTWTAAIRYNLSGPQPGDQPLPTPSSAPPPTVDDPDLSGLLNPLPHARGGPTVAGTTYLVGEHGPEFWTAGVNGFVTPNEQIPAWAGGQVRGGDGGEMSTLMAQQLAATREQNYLLRRQLAALQAVPAGMADAFNGVSRRAAFLGRGTPPVF